MTTYVDASVILRIVLCEGNPLPEWGSIESGVTSALTRVECLRTLDRARLRGLLDDRGVMASRASVITSLGGISSMRPSREILERASNPFPTTLATLDAVHLASALHWRDRRGEPIRLATHDRQLGRCARAMGLPVIGLDDGLADI
ncbi:MAG: PIN domain-containing protein [Candidatus Eisenbacteria bacterium]|nr:PIN domain-containing protein [Candidatus Eisenbacteria bacterium]